VAAAAVVTEGLLAKMVALAVVVVSQVYQVQAVLVQRDKEIMAGLTQLLAHIPLVRVAVLAL
jgi:hypothetical protein